MLSLRAVVQFNYLTAELIAGACRVSNYKALYELGHHYGNSDSRSSKIVSKSCLRNHIFVVTVVKLYKKPCQRYQSDSTPSPVMPHFTATLSPTTSLPHLMTELSCPYRCRSAAHLPGGLLRHIARFAFSTSAVPVTNGLVVLNDDGYCW